MKALLIVLSILGCMAACGHAQCSLNEVTATWMDREAGDDFPLGFDTLGVPGTDEISAGETYPCIQVNFPNCNGIRYLTVAIESENDQICVRRFNAGETSTCGSGQVQHCVNNVAASTQLDFSCESSCPQTMYSVQYRVFLNCTDSDDEFFCNNQEIDFPSSLFQIPTQPTVDPNPMTDPGSGSPRLSPFLLASLLLMTLLALVFAH